jgi:crotonobetaine/carnitine-CoA ligase
MQRTLPQMLTVQAERHGTRPLLTIGDVTWTFRDALEAAQRRAGTLVAAGIGPGDRVALLLTNRFELIELVLACGWIGAVAVPVNTAAMGPQIGYFLGNSGARILAIEAGLAHRLAHMEAPLPALERVWVVGGEAGIAIEGVTVAALPPRGEAQEAAAVRPGDTLAILYTSGTTGPSKGVMCPHTQYYWWGANSIELLEITSDDVLATTLPLFHINALSSFAQALLSGGRMVLYERFSASAFWPAMGQCGATVLYVLGAMVPILLARPVTPEERSHRVRIALGPGVPPDMIRAFIARTGIPVLEGYASTETNFMIGGRIAEQKPGSIGRIRPGYHARVVDEQDFEVEPGVAGELLLRADEPFAFANGYFGMPGKTVEAWRNLWFHTGDRVVRDADGHFRFLDRLKDAIRRRGENISSFEVEQVLLSHEAIENVAVFPAKSELAEDEVMAAIVLKAGATLDPAHLMAFCETRMPYYAIPRFIDFVAELPRTESGKVQKFKLREQGPGDKTWDRERAGIVLKRR